MLLENILEENAGDVVEKLILFCLVGLVWLLIDDQSHEQESIFLELSLSAVHELAPVLVESLDPLLAVLCLDVIRVCQEEYVVIYRSEGSRHNHGGQRREGDVQELVREHLSAEILACSHNEHVLVILKASLH